MLIPLIAMQLKEAFDILNDDINRILYDATYPQGLLIPLERAQAQQRRSQWVQKAGTQLKRAYVHRLQLFQYSLRHQILSCEYQDAIDEEIGAKWYGVTFFPWDMSMNKD